MVIIKDRELHQQLKDNNNKCLCTVDETECMCEEFKNVRSGVCHCGVYEKVGEEE